MGARTPKDGNAPGPGGRIAANAATVVDTVGRLPPFWDQSVLFVANLLALFFGNEAETDLLRREVRGAESYGGRLVPILNLLYHGPHNRLLLERPANPELLEYFGDDLALHLPAVEVLSHRDYEEMGRALRAGDPLPATLRDGRLDARGAIVVDGYVTDATLAALASRLGLPTVSTLEGSRNGNNKLLLHQALARAGLPVFETRLASSAAEAFAHLAELGSLGYRSAVLKSQIGASGIGLRKVPTRSLDERESIPPMMFHEGPCMVQGWIEAGERGVTNLWSPSVQMFLDTTRIHLYDITEQILGEESVHQGNEAPPPYLAGRDGLREALIRQAGVAGRWLHAGGYRGTASVDFLVAQSGEEATAFVCEINARVTGATYPAVLARHFTPQGAWLMRNLRLATPIDGRQVLAALRRQKLLFARGSATGVLPINFNTGPGGGVDKGQFLFLASESDRCRGLLAEAESALGVVWHFERD